MSNLNETNLLKATMTQPRLAFELVKALGKASEDLMTYERINSRPDRELARKSKLGEAVKYSSKVVGVVSPICQNSNNTDTRTDKNCSD